MEDTEQIDALLKTAYMRGWVEPLENAIPKGKLGPGGELPRGTLFQGVGPIWRLTDGGWAIVHRNHRWMLLAS